MADANSTATTPEGSRTEPELKYEHLPWGELIHGTKEQLQSIRLGVGMPFPGEPGGNRREMRVTDPRGFPAAIYSSSSGDGVFHASIRFPGRECPCSETEWKPVCFGVKKREFIGGDEFIGTGEALSAAGLVEINQLPGQPGMRKVAVTIHPDGTVASGAPTANNPKARLEGAKRITKNGKARYLVTVNISHEEGERRRCVFRQKTDEWGKRMAALPRPKPLHVSGHRFQPLKQKEAHYSSPESFKNFAIRCADELNNFDFIFNGEFELAEHGEKTIWLDDQSLQEIASARARLVDTVRAARVVKAKPRLSIVK